MNRFARFFIVPALLALLPLLGACGGVKSEAKYPTGADRATTNDDIYAEPESIFGEGGLTIFDNTDKEEETGIGVNAYLWRAALDTISFMPLASADPFGGTILTDWYQPPEKQNERLKLNVFVLSKQLRSDGIRVRVFRQIRKSGKWVDAETDESTGTKLEDAILTRARQLRVSGLGIRD